MNREAIIAIFRAVPVWLWPFVWLQLVVLFGWMKRQQREVLVRVDHRSGRIRVAFVEDAPAMAEPWRPVTLRVPAWQRVAVADEAVPCPRRARYLASGPVRGVSLYFPGTLRARPARRRDRHVLGPAPFALKTCILAGGPRGACGRRCRA
ncbi:hypothetical protein [Hyphomonas sp.]|uniref:hypothetical protein n=1 Tax=Hyphomonas sp. TaxID=87 RepID=UPI0030FA1B2F